MDPTNQAVQLELALEVADYDRTRVLQHVIESDTDSTLDEVVETLYRRESTSSRRGGTTREDLGLELYHVHLPKLDGAGTVRYHPSATLEKLLHSVGEEIHS